MINYDDAKNETVKRSTTDALAQLKEVSPARYNEVFRKMVEAISTIENANETSWHTYIDAEIAMYELEIAVLEKRSKELLASLVKMDEENKKLENRIEELEK